MPASRPIDLSAVAVPVAPHRLTGTVVAALLNDPAQLAAMGDAVHQAPYKAAPRAPVLAVRPRNALCAAGSAVGVPADAPALQVGATLGIVIGRTACRVPAGDALAHVAGYLPVVDLQIPHDSAYRPAVRHKARDGFCVLGTAVVPAGAVPAPDALAVQVAVDGAVLHRSRTAGRQRGVAQLVADVSAFMTLQPGDVLLLGPACEQPLARAGQSVVATLEGLGEVGLQLVAEAAAVPAAPALSLSAGALPPITARVVYGGTVHTAQPLSQPEPGASADTARIRLDDGRVLAETEVQWLAPFDVGTIIALGLNYADHLKELKGELTVTAKDEPLVFLKSIGSVTGHRGHTRRPADATFMHYECELAVVIGRTARHVPRAQALQHVAGYTVCNDYAVRDYLENWYRPNLRVKNRDGGTVLGPWFVPAERVPDPQALALRTRVNGTITQQGVTANMVNDVAGLIEYLSSFMTLNPGDVILTGTPEGTVNVHAGDTVVCEIDGIGRLTSQLLPDTDFGR